MENTFIMDIDGTICESNQNEDGTYDYPNATPIQPVIDRINQLYDQGNTIILSTARGMRTHKGDTKKIKQYVLPVLVEWLQKHNVKYHDVRIGKPWGEKPIYVDNRNISVKTFAYDNPEFFENIIKAENTL